MREKLFVSDIPVMSKSVRPEDLTAVYLIVRTDRIFKISPNDWLVQKDFNISELFKSADMTKCVVMKGLRYCVYSQKRQIYST